MPMPPTTIMTSVLVSASLAVVDLAALHACGSGGFGGGMADNTTAGRAQLRRLRRRALQRLAEFGLPLLAFIGGASLGAFLQRVGGFIGLAIPCAALGLVFADMAALMWREHRAEAAAEAAAAAAQQA